MESTSGPASDQVHPEAVAQLEAVTKVYPMGAEQVRALAGVTVAIRRGSYCAIMGPSGSGKSTMLNVLGCLDRPTSGRYLLENQNVGAMNDDALSGFRLRHLGFIFQSFNLIGQLTVLENIELPLFYLGSSARQSRQRAAELADRVGLADRIDHRPAELSGGQQQRVAIARALANDPSLIMADEPTGNLDSATGRQIMELFDQLHEQGKTIVLVTHEQEVAAHATVRLHMRDGLIEHIEDEG